MRHLKEDTADCVGKGWRPLVQSLIDQCHAEGVKILQIKEKFGGLRFYTEPHQSAVLEEMIRGAENGSFHICEDCGTTEDVKHGNLKESGWIKTLCLGCREVRENAYDLGNK